MFLRQGRDHAAALRIRVPPGFRPPVRSQAIQVKAHLIVEEGVPYLRYITHQRATIQAVPQRVFWLNSLVEHGRNADPLESITEIRAQVQKSMQIDDDTVDLLMKQLDSKGRFKNSFQNSVLLSGFVAAKAFVMPEDPNDRPHIHLLLKQHPDSSRAIPIDIMNVDNRFGALLSPHFGIRVQASAKMVPSGEEGGEPTLSIRSNYRGVQQADGNAFEHRRWPKWAMADLKEYLNQRKAAQVARATAAAVAAGEIPNPNLATAAVEAGPVPVLDAPPDVDAESAADAEARALGASLMGSSAPEGESTAAAS
ncbi:MAG TPA: hypothetical protein VFQ88_09430 [Nevskiaceae bacterium]|nr:hypothetical protein [Nevskiaceae bacterium]